ncbi:hypothetical protein IE077_002513 [Cardiosporidium cionae]|uniref:Uncharacterized protein n=1 Tax=Cardiosporidium cionae TaxID=476202 RepID=A0ABQ7JAN3_9APIC|nr:hypothetical protein IE077_002513 [Cardiosporidium cionae]|eukprot:KAF8821047.1 hypothetical protein IE077_002513 [Cardiosporidium cionae]
MEKESRFLFSHFTNSGAKLLPYQRTAYASCNAIRKMTLRHEMNSSHDTINSRKKSTIFSQFSQSASGLVSMEKLPSSRNNNEKVSTVEGISRKYRRKESLAGKITSDATQPKDELRLEVSTLGGRNPLNRSASDRSEIIPQITALAELYFAFPRIFVSSSYSHVFVAPLPHWVELRHSAPFYLQNFEISAIDITASIRTSDKRLDRFILNVADMLPLDTPHMTLQIGSERRRFIVCSWEELFQSLRNSYLRQLIRKTLPSVLANPFAFFYGFFRGVVALVQHSISGAKLGDTYIEGFIAGLREGFLLFMTLSIGGLFQTTSHFLSTLYKLLGGRLSRPYGILDAVWKGTNGMILDIFWNPWNTLVVDTFNAVKRGDGVLKTTTYIVRDGIRCLFSPLLGVLNLLTSVTEGFANSLFGNFEQFTRVAESSDLGEQKDDMFLVEPIENMKKLHSKQFRKQKSYA